MLVGFKELAVGFEPIRNREIFWINNNPFILKDSMSCENFNDVNTKYPFGLHKKN